MEAVLWCKFIQCSEWVGLGRYDSSRGLELCHCHTHTVGDSWYLRLTSASTVNS